MADDDALFQKGMPIRREVLGPEYVDASMARADDFMMSFQRATTAWAWGWAWGDATLDRKTRSMEQVITIGLDLAKNVYYASRARDFRGRWASYLARYRSQDRLSSWFVRYV
jgi:hypothetical protein